MIKYQVLWADDHWVVEGNAIKDSASPSWLEPAAQEIEDQLREAGIAVEWLKIGDAAGAATQIERGVHDVRLVLVDYQFAGTGYYWQDVMPPVRRRNIPFMLYSSFLGDAKMAPEFARPDPLFLGMYSKSRDDMPRFVKRVVDFFRAPPFRLLHLTDLHYQASPGIEEKRERDRLFTSLVETLKQEQALRPIDAVVITGDFACHHPADDLGAIRAEVRAIVNSTIRIDNLDRLFIVPGNHDLAWKSFAEGVLGDMPWHAYVDFYQSMYNTRSDILTRMKAWKADERLLDLRARKQDLTWRARVPGVAIDVIGIASPSEDPRHRGEGEIGTEQLKFVRDCWSGEPLFGEVRIALMHHNLVSVLSMSIYDEKRIVRDAGEALLTLMRSNCSLVLSGHAHASHLFSCRAAHSRGNQLTATGGLTVVAAGTMGGSHGARDRQRTFNILDFSQGEGKTGRRALSVRGLYYDSSEGAWLGSSAPYAPDGLFV
jgi:predicted phosphodiesterase